MRIRKSGWALWALYAGFAVVASYANWQASTLEFSGALGGFKLFVWLALLGFLAYSFYCTTRENFFRSTKTVISLYWGRQIVADLYLGILIGLLIIVANDGFVVALVWLVPLLIYANLTMLLYVALHFDELVAKLMLL